jgi:hypothetical protein
LEFLRDTGTLRVDPDAGELGQALHRKADPGPRRNGNSNGNGPQAGAAAEMSK